MNEQANGEAGGVLTVEERQELAAGLRWHFRCHAAEPDESYAALGIENAILIIGRVLADRDAALARAWDEGYASGAEESSELYDGRIPPNPYRAALHAAPSDLSATQ